MFINYAHRGASAYAPENTMLAFRKGVALGANGIETDIRKTKDGVLVLFHDGSLLRLTGIEKAVSDLTYSELSALRIPSPDGTSYDSVPTLAAFLDYAKDLPVSLALELKDVGTEPEVLQAAETSGVAERSIITSFSLGHIANVKALSPSQKVGLLTREVNDEILRKLRAVGAEQICPKADLLSPALVQKLHSAGFSVRAWGVPDEETMRRALSCGVDGMTVNFPDKLAACLREKEYL